MMLEHFIQRHQLPGSFTGSAERCYLPFARWLEAELGTRAGTTFVLGINGAQGSGKSTLAQLISEYLAREHGRRVVILSIDDLYLTLDERESLGRDVHPLLRTRGVPGTHDVALGVSVIDRLQALKPGETMKVPRFDKSRDDRCPESDWALATGPVELVVFEGWCVASQAVSAAELEEPINALESSQDADGRWRAYANDQLGNDYVRLFGSLDALLFLRVPDFDAVRRWRLEQEHKLRRSALAGANAIMSDEQVAGFIQHYERITRHNIEVLPSLADAVIDLDAEHRALSLSYAARD